MKTTLPARSKIEIPFWLAKGLLDMKMVKVQLPNFFSDEFLKIFCADSEIANLRDKSFYFYKFGKHIVNTFGNNS